MRLSVVINTCNRAGSLRRTLAGLRRQTHSDFEVVLVVGPCTDDTDMVLAELEGQVRVVRCPELHLSKSRNLGIDAAAGDVVAFIDDDAIPEPRWLEELEAAYDSDEVAGAGGIVYDHTGARLQYEYSICDRVGEPRFDAKPPLDACQVPGADPFVYLQGTNASFRRDRLAEIGGFDEEIEYYLDEVEACLQLIDRGYALRPVAGAAVHHQYLPSHRRNCDGIVFDPYATVKNRLYFALRNGRATRALVDILDEQLGYLHAISAHANRHRAEGRMTAEELVRFRARLRAGVEVGIERGLHASRRDGTISPPDPGAYVRFETCSPAGGRLNVCFVSAELPPGDFGGIGRFTADLAAGFGAIGHEVHVIATGEDHDRVDFEHGVWVHRVVTRDRGLPELDGVPAASNLYRAATIAQELDRIHRASPIDVVSAPLWASEACVCMLDARFPTVVTLMTSMHTIAGMHQSWEGDALVAQLIELERATIRRAGYLHGLSAAVLEDVRAAFRPRERRAYTIPLGVHDRRQEHPPRRSDSDGRVRVLFVGRLERRKGVDVLLDAARTLLAEAPDAELVLVGKDTENTELGESYRAAFERASAGAGDWVDRVTFVGAVPEDELYRHYADCDVFCAPSRYESFGLVLVEAMGFGKPVVGCNAGGMSEVVQDGVTGLLAQPGDVDSLLDALRRLVRAPELRERLGRAARGAFEERFALPVTIERTVAAYREIAAGAAAEPSRGAGRSMDRPAVEPRLAELLADALAMPAAAASRLAAGLLEPWRAPVDATAPAHGIEPRLDEDFVAHLYNVHLGRQPPRADIVPYVVELQRGVAREDVEDAIRTSPEARALAAARAGERGGATGEERGDARAGERGGATVSAIAGAPLAAPAAAPAPSRAGRAPTPGVRRRVRSLPLAGKAGRYAKRLVLAPWNAQRTYDQALRLERILRTHVEALKDTSFRDEVARHRDAIRQDSAREGLISAVAELPHRLGEAPAVLGRDVRGLAAQVEVLQRKQEMLALDLRERALAGGGPREPQKPRIPDPEGYGLLTESMGGALRVNLGCGEKPLAGHVNVDMRMGAGIDVVADARKLPFEPRSLTEIASFHLVEHFREHQLRLVVLPYWRSLLRADGVLRTVCPNWQAMIARLQAGEMSYAVFKTLTFGLQDYDGDDHFAMYTPESLGEVLRAAGFQEVDVVVAERQNGLCPEMEMVARP